MASSNQVSSMLVLMFDGGVDASGKPVVINKRFNGVKPNATDDQVYAIAQALAPLQQYPALNIERDNTVDISA
jgi:hypothetical protein